MTEFNSGAPEWQMDDAYGSFADPRWTRGAERVRELIAEIARLTKDLSSDETLRLGLEAYEEALTIESSMSAFAKCTGAKDTTDASAMAASNFTAARSSRRSRQSPTTLLSGA